MKWLRKLFGFNRRMPTLEELTRQNRRKYHTAHKLFEENQRQIDGYRKGGAV